MPYQVTPFPVVKVPSLFALRRALDHLALDYGDWAVASGRVEHFGDADEHLEHVAEALEAALDGSVLNGSVLAGSGLAGLTTWSIADVEAVIADQRTASAWSARAVLRSLRDFLAYLHETGQWQTGQGELQRCEQALSLALRSLDQRGSRVPA